ncbi:hypothetical protein HMPREF9954_1221 [Streptococcus infantis SK970]|nr:hypothetical protein HMPREF9954_1221 [Streptococcus infantis SK970]
MMKIPVENLGLFEQLDRIIVAFFRKQQPSSPYDLNISITQEHLDQKKQELEPLGYQAVQLPLGMALDNVIQQPHYKSLIIGGLAPDEIIVSKEELMPLKDIVDSFCIMYAAANNRLENSKAYDLMKIKQSILLVNYLLTFLKKVMKLLIWVLIVQLVTVRDMKLLNVF